MTKKIVLQNATGEDLYPHTSVECVNGFADAVEKKVFNLAYKKSEIDAMVCDHVKHRDVLSSDKKTFKI